MYRKPCRPPQSFHFSHNRVLQPAGWHVIIRHPAAFLGKGIIIVDTPGTNSLQTLNTEETLAFLPKVDSAIFLLSADQPINQEELSLLEMLKTTTAKIFVVLNKIDLLSPEDLAESVEYCTNILRNVMADAQILPVSSRWYLEGRKKESGIVSLKETLESFFKDAQHEIELKSSIIRCQKILTLKREQVALERKAVELSSLELAESIKQFQTFKDEIKETKQDFRHIINGQTKLVQEQMTKQIEDFRQEKSFKLTREIKQRFNNHGTLKEVQSYSFARIYEELESLRPIVSEEYHERTRLLLKRLSQEAEELSSHITAVGGKVLKTKVTVELPEPVFTNNNTLEYFIEKAVGLVPFNLEDAVSILPWSLSKNIIVNRISEKAIQLMDKNCGRIRADIAERLAVATRNYMELWESELDRIVRLIESAIEKGIQMQEDTLKRDEWQTDLNNREEKLNSIADKIQFLLET
ncbi:MAG: hypothetical protein GX434_01590 [Peptococcaceae bacterium]|nr:hypothetical protein [Peptococcaceae bacterium]